MGIVRGFTVAVILGTIAFGGSWSLRLTEVIVPTHANLGETVTLVCHFELDDARLYSVKWYKDEYEFYRFMPDNIPQTQLFPLTGIHVDESSSDMNQVTLTQVNYNSSGTYRCEVSTEAPNFDTAFRGGNMTVLAFPDHGPLISGVMDTSSVGDYITGNCTSGKSYPAPKLSWQINGVKADSWAMDKYPLMEHSGEYGSYHTGTYGTYVLYSRALGLRFKAEKRHFQGASSSIILKCTAVVADLPPETTKVEIRLASASANQKLAQERLLNHGNGQSISNWWLGLLCLTILATITANS